LALNPFTGPAYNAGSNSLAAQFGLSTDQRGDAPVSNGTVDIGAFESVKLIVPIVL
jgi:hypothetical protein